MTPIFETLEDISVASEIGDTTVAVRLRRQLNYRPSRFTSGPYWLDLHVGSVHTPLLCGPAVRQRGCNSISIETRQRSYTAPALTSFKVPLLSRLGSVSSIYADLRFCLVQNMKFPFSSAVVDIDHFKHLY